MFVKYKIVQFFSLTRIIVSQPWYPKMRHFIHMYMILRKSDICIGIFIYLKEPSINRFVLYSIYVYFDIWINTHTSYKHRKTHIYIIYHHIRNPSSHQLDPVPSPFHRKMFSRFHHCTLTNLYGPTVPLIDSASWWSFLHVGAEALIFIGHKFHSLKLTVKAPENRSGPKRKDRIPTW